MIILISVFDVNVYVFSKILKYWLSFFLKNNKCINDIFMFEEMKNIV